MYAGISGSTHGEIKLTNPAKNASAKEIIITLVGAFCYPIKIKHNQIINRYQRK